jgi:4-hydroxy-2-oxoheptanedioate aldolase
MTRETGLRSRMERGEAVLSAWSGLPDSLTVEAVAGLLFDAVTLDMQHGAHHEDSVARGLAAVIAAGRNALVRIPVGRFDMASRALDFGAEAVIAPMVNSVGDAQAFAAAMKYPPVGKRSWGPSLAMPRRQTRDAAAWLAGANIATMAFAMIETREAFAAVDSILAVPGIDGVFVGPSDFSIAWTGGAVVDPGLPDMMDAIGAIGGRARAAGKSAGIYVVDPALAGRYHAMGYGLIAIGSEARYMAQGAENLIKAARASIKS